jgi:hypothetical protein
MEAKAMTLKRGRCTTCKIQSAKLAPGPGMFGKHFLFCPKCRGEQERMIAAREALAAHPIAGRYIQKWIKWDKDNVCRCEITDHERECFIGDVYVLETPEESGTFFGKSTAITHIGCGKPVMLTEKTTRSCHILSKQEIQLR